MNNSIDEVARQRIDDHIKECVNRHHDVLQRMGDIKQAVLRLHTRHNGNIRILVGVLLSIVLALVGYIWTFQINIKAFVN